MDILQKSKPGKIVYKAYEALDFMIYIPSADSSKTSIHPLAHPHMEIAIVKHKTSLSMQDIILSFSEKTQKKSKDKEIFTKRKSTRNFKNKVISMIKMI